MVITIHERDIESGVCQRCAECCRIQLSIKGTDSRYRQFLRTVGFVVIPSPSGGEADCCDKEHDITLDMGYCTHLKQTNDGVGRKFYCKLYGTSEFPKLCSEYNCVAWAKARNSYGESSTVLRAAQVALDAYRAAGASSANAP